MKDGIVRLSDGRSVALATYGAETGRPVFVLHGTPVCRLGMDIVDQTVRSRGVRLLAPDRPGIGGTDPPLLPSAGAYAHEVASIADALGIERFAVIGYSGGAPFALGCGALLPDRLTAVATMGGVIRPDTRALREALGPEDRHVLTLLARGDDAAASRYLRLLAMAVRWAPGLLLALMKRALDESDRRVVGRWLIPTITGAFAQGTAGVLNDYRLWAAPWGFELADIHVPLDVWHGLDDRDVGTVHAETLAAAIPGANLHLVPRTGHFALVTHIGEILDVMAAAESGRIEARHGEEGGPPPGTRR